MEEMEYIYEPISNIISILRIVFISIFTLYTSVKVIDKKLSFNNILLSIITIIISIIFINIFAKNIDNYIINILLLILILSILLSKTTKNSLSNSIVINMISLGINYIVYFMALTISFFPAFLINIENDYFNLTIIVIVYTVLIKGLFKIRRLKDGIIVIKNKMNNEQLQVLILSISTIIVLIAIILNNLYYTDFVLAKDFLLSLIVFFIIMIITIQNTLTMYYKHKKLIEELNETKQELENTKKDRDKVEQENIEISKTNHSISHKIKSLNKKIDKLMRESEIANEIDLRDRINEVSKEYNRKKVNVELSKTGIEVIDDMLDCMKEECIENNIELELQLSGNIHHMTNNYIPKEELEILLADHIKDAVIAIKHTDNINRSILVRLGLIDEFYSLYIYDSGIEFEIDTLTNLGTKAVTTHKEDGGTGMGFLNTFDTLNKHKASMVIEEIGKPSKDNYTKVIMIKFDNKNEFRIKSYRAQEIEQRGINNNNQIDIK